MKTKTVTKTFNFVDLRFKNKTNGLQHDDSKPAQLAKLIFPAIVRMIRSKKSLAVEKSVRFTLDSDNARRICLDGD